ncbi:unnamed protein product [Caenorhabditis bovis]|uniref:Uncharacterized protein n=1 Tax=Caenorhabditis bovis TaxID=2654633 RepID=A0A8S1F1L8_9PELO|nr:unnamed protein product [Caenorhabditis bovis]
MNIILSFPADDFEKVARSDENASNRTGTSSTAKSLRKITLMDIFDVRKFQSHRDFVFADGRLHAVSDYSLIALLPVILVAILIVGIFCVYRFRRWKSNRKQLAELSAFYEIVESSPCISNKSFLIQHLKHAETHDCDRVSRAVCVPTTNSLFFQPVPPKCKPTKPCSNVLKALNANDVIFHFSQLPENEKPRKKNSLIHRV